MFAHRPSNRQRNRWVVSLLGVQPTDQVLEIGFGPGVAVAALARAGAGHVYGIDHSAVMLRQASRRNDPLTTAIATALTGASLGATGSSVYGWFR
jgi:ubiquinone/menaquinone biosynthesis C-methylase UbiE